MTMDTAAGPKVGGRGPSSASKRLRKPKKGKKREKKKKRQEEVRQFKYNKRTQKNGNVE